MAVILRMGERAVGNLRVRVSPLAELCAGLHALCESEHHPASAEWIAAVRTHTPDDLLAEVDSWAPLVGVRRARFFFPMTDEPAHTLDEELATIAGLELDRFVTQAAEAVVRGKWRAGHRHLLADRAAARQFVEAARRLSSYRFALAEGLVKRPGEIREALLGFLRRFAAEVFADEWGRVLPAVRAEAQLRQRELRVHGAGVLPRTVPTARELTDPHRVVFDKLYHADVAVEDRPCVLVPSIHGSPHVVVKHWDGLPIVVQYAVSDTLGAPTSETVTRRLDVLTDPTRGEICRALVRERRTTSDLAQTMHLPVPQISRHLRALREAGLVDTHREGRFVYYTLDVEAVRRIGIDMLGVLHR